MTHTKRKKGTLRRYRKPFVERSQFGDVATYARALRAAGGPQLGDRSCRCGSDDDSRITAMVFGRDDAEFEEMLEWEAAEAQRKARHKFKH